MSDICREFLFSDVDGVESMETINDNVADEAEKVADEADDVESMETINDNVADKADKVADEADDVESMETINDNVADEVAYKADKVADEADDVANDVADKVADKVTDKVADKVAPYIEDPMYFEIALIEVVKSALKTAKHLDKRQAENCDQAAYKKLVQALNQEYQIPILTVAENLQLGKYAGLCKLYAECVVIRDWDKEVFLNEQIKPQRA